MAIEPYIPVPKEYNFSCTKCGSKDIEYRCPDNDGCYEDYEYHCKGCNRHWWVEGADY